MSKLRHAALALFLLMDVTLKAQNPIPPPVEPLVNNASTYASWTIECTPNQVSAAVTNPNSGPPSLIKANGTLRKVSTTKMGKDHHEVNEWTDGSTSEIWFYNDVLLFNQLGTSDIYIRTRQNATTFLDYAKSDFPELNWLSLSAYRGIKSYNQHTCYWFQITPPSGSEDKSSPDSVPPRPSTEAWIDVKTKLPVALNDGYALKVYTFHDLSPQEPNLPPAFARAYEKYKKATDAFRQKDVMKF